MFFFKLNCKIITAFLQDDKLKQAILNGENISTKQKKQETIKYNQIFKQKRKFTFLF